MKGFRFVVFLLLLLSACKSTRYIPPAVSHTRTEYIATYSNIAIREMRRTGIPASIKMAQAILESGDGNSTLARQANNHFGIKCHNWTGRKIYHDDDLRNECFRSYNSPEESFLDHSDFLTGRARYASLFDLDPSDYKSWARGLKEAGYATNPNYASLLIRIIEDNELYKLDAGILTAGNQRIVTPSANNTSGSGTSAQREVMKRNRIRYLVAGQGDTYESLTREMELMSWEISRYNDMSGRNSITPGDIIYLQPKRARAARGFDTHIVKQGQTMHQISQLYGIKLNRLLRRNYMEQGQEPSPGDTIFLRRQPYREDPRIN